jgi:hypothetical protein
MISRGSYLLDTPNRSVVNMLFAVVASQDQNVD